MPPRFSAIAASRGRLLFMPPDRRLEWTKTTQALTARGVLQKTPESIVVTPKGLAALLGEVGIEIAGTGSRSADLTEAPPGCTRAPK